jgi:hypothetical protein
VSLERLRPDQEQHIGAGSRERAAHKAADTAETENRVSHDRSYARTRDEAGTTMIDEPCS